ncbi:hypothetical protein XA68_15984 [Ophiocordyceps unilateralis]|uniref:Something about silencing protein 4 domain-containing protein n=1 Tax=Ophiocordyceps unilateralis TaxID=268505 RepID=A0A2A9P5U0_OPHUN|nr:hypothetical protein XA68_15984 [Ophiocordyceps unilateralis]
MAPVSRSARLGAEGLHHRARIHGAAVAVAPHHEKRRRVAAAAEDDVEASRPSRKKMRLGQAAPAEGAAGFVARHASGEGGAIDFMAKQTTTSDFMAQPNSSKSDLARSMSGAGGASAADDQDEDGGGGGGITTKHRARVINGVKTEVDRLQPQAPSARSSSQGRKLRSQEATRFKSELSAYFVDYDEVIGNDPKEQHIVNLETSIVVIDSATGRPREASYEEALEHLPRGHDDAPEYPVRSYGDALFADILDAQRIDFGFLETPQNSNSIEDPLPDSLYESVHRRARRLERSIRNAEKGRAQHEKNQIIRLLEALQGHDWLRVMGVSGITETKKKAFEPAREYFIKGCQAILDKFRNWSQAEKLRKQKRKRTTTSDDGKRDRKFDQGRGREAGHQSPATARQDREDSSAADLSDDASEASSSPAQQLRHEALARTRVSSSAAPPGSNSRRGHAPSSSPPPPPPAPPSPRPFTTFFSKSYEREAAVNRNRRKGRKVLAWGHPIPDMAEDDFMLPEEYRDEDTLKTRARKKRLDKRSKRS